jgi:hypothetical protein
MIVGLTEQRIKDPLRVNIYGKNAWYVSNSTLIEDPYHGTSSWDPLQNMVYTIHLRFAPVHKQTTTDE